MIVLNLVDDWYITASTSNFLVGKWNGKSYEPKRVKTLDGTSRMPELHDKQEFNSLYECFNFIYKTYQLRAFEEAESGNELFEILINLNKSMEIIANAVSGSFLKLQKEDRRKKRNRD